RDRPRVRPRRDRRAARQGPRAGPGDRRRGPRLRRPRGAAPGPRRQRGHPVIPMTLAAVADVTGGRLHGATPEQAADILIDADVVTDSREARPGSLYVARIGEQADGHDFVPGAAEAGAVAALTTREVEGLPCVDVPDEQAGFVAIARHV